MQAQPIEREGAGVAHFITPVRDAGTEMPEAVRRVVRSLGESAEAELVRFTFVSLMELLAELQTIGINCIGPDPVKESVAAFASVQESALVLVGHVEEQVLTLEDISKSPGRELLDVAFALRHELRRAFDMDIAEIDHGRPFESAEGRVAHAHGVLRNCFRQCVVLLAQAYEPPLSERTIFADAASRLEESILLRDSLASLLEVVRDESKKSFPQSAVAVIERLDMFRREALPFLMRRDWEMFDAFENELVAAKDGGEFDYAMRKLLVGLETLLGQVRMRSVFNDLPPAATKKSSLGFARRLTAVRPATWSAVAASLLLAGGLAFFADTTLVIRGSEIDSAGVSTSVQNVIAKTTPPAAKTEAATKPAEPAKAVEAPKPAKVEAVKTVEAAKPAAGALTLQVGAFRDASAADESAARLRKQGVEARVEKGQKDGQPVYRVQVGSFNADSAAQSFGQQLRAKGVAQSFLVTRTGK